MKYFIDTEFIEGFHKPLFGKRRHFIDLISIGIVCEDGREFSAISSEYNYHDASEWVKDNVILPLYTSTVPGLQRGVDHIHSFHKHYGKPNKQIAQEIIEFIYQEEEVSYHIDIRGKKKAENVSSLIELWGYYCDYDHVLFCSLFGTMMDLPKGFPMYMRDLKQLMDKEAEDIVGTGVLCDNIDQAIDIIKNHPDYPLQSREHDALSDARWNKKLYEFLTK